VYEEFNKPTSEKRRILLAVKLILPLGLLPYFEALQPVFQILAKYVIQVLLFIFKRPQNLLFMKPRIFIGSSSEGKKKADLVKKQLSKVADCEVWHEGFFENNKSYFESLNERATLFDFAILVATAEDVQLKRDKIESITRDNILFEFGLCVGRIGRNRSFFLKEKGIDLPSDLFGISLLEFTTLRETEGKSFTDICKNLKKRVKEVWETYELSLVPSTVLAVGYYENFAFKVSNELMNADKRSVEEKNFDDFRLHVVIPDQLPNNFTSQVKEYLKHRNLKEMKVETETRKYNFYLDYAQQEGTILELYDLPTTLSALKKSIEMAIPKSYIGDSKNDVIFKKKEMHNFCRTLSYLVNEDAITRNRVIIEFIDVKEEK
jgi:hypothetical protein